jgi:hypothetical protein
MDLYQLTDDRPARRQPVRRGRVYWPDEEPENGWISEASIRGLCSHCGHDDHASDDCTLVPH